MDRKYLEKALKPRRGLGQAATRHRRKLITTIERERTTRESERRDKAMSAIREASRYVEQDKIKERVHWANSLLSTITNQQTAVLRSRGMKHPVIYDLDIRNIWWASLKEAEYEEGEPIVRSAYTDFEKVHASFTVSAIPDMYKTTELIDTIASIRGVFQHEFGHLLHTTPFPVLLEQYETGREDMDGKLYLHEMAHSIGVDNYQSFQYAWNVLEDQRMESLTVLEVPRLKLYFTSMVLSVIATEDSIDNAWILCAGRKYLPKDIRYYAKKEFRPDKPELADTWLGIVNTYKTATTPNQMVDAVVEAMKFLHNENVGKVSETRHVMSYARTSDYEPVDRDKLEKQGQTLSGEGEPMDGYEPPIDDSPETGKSEDQQNQGSDAKGKGSGGGNARGTGDDETKSTSSSSDTNNRVSMPSVTVDVTPDTNKRGHDKSSGDGTLKHAVDQTLNEIMSDIRADVDNLNVLQEATISSSTRSIPVLEDESMPRLDDHHVQTALTMCGRIQDALSDYVTASDPHWVDRVDHGVINPLAFRTKEVGSNEYRRDRVGEATDGLNIHVSFLSDVSMSMEGPPMTALSIAMYAMGEACVRLGVGATYTLWSSDNETYRIWEDGIPKPQLMGAMGGTDPTAALDDLANHNPEDAKHHLVFIFTDGDWGRSRPLSDWSVPGRKLVVVRYTPWQYESTYDQYGGDALINITKVEDMPSALHRVMSEMLTSSLENR